LEKLSDENADQVSTRATVSKRTVKLALSGVLAGVYAVSTIALGFVSYGPFNLRLANILIGLVPILGWPSVVGITVGVFLGNLASPLGVIDYVSPIFSFAGLSILYYLRNKSVIAGLFAYSLILSLWVTEELVIVRFVGSSSYWVAFVPVLGGISIVVVGFGYVLYKGLEHSGLKKKVEGRIG
jgi:hypothetical protein